MFQSLPRTSACWQFLQTFVEKIGHCQEFHSCDTMLPLQQSSCKIPNIPIGNESSSATRRLHTLTEQVQQMLSALLQRHYKLSAWLSAANFMNLQISSRTEQRASWNWFLWSTSCIQAKLYITNCNTKHHKCWSCCSLEWRVTLLPQDITVWWMSVILVVFVYIVPSVKHVGGGIIVWAAGLAPLVTIKQTLNYFTVQRNL